MQNRLWSYFAILLFAFACLAQVGKVVQVGQDPGPAGGGTPDGRQLGGVMDGQPARSAGDKAPSSKTLENEHAQNVKDAQTLAKLSGELRDSLEKSSSNALSVTDLKKADDIEKLIKKLHSRLKHDYGESGQGVQNSAPGLGNIGRGSR
jgi:hypothetical protein